jgi:hypothetical protein
MSTSHPLVLALFDTPTLAARGAAAVHAIGIDREHLSVVSRSHEEEGELAREMGGTPGVEIEDSRAASLLGEISGHVLAAIAVVMPGIGPIVTAGPLAAELGEAAGHAAGGLASVLQNADIREERASEWERAVEEGAVLLAIHASAATADRVGAALTQAGAREIELGRWSE